ncbi:kelch-like protein 1 [Episyrphus balteatus]|uniref:kelch-like protein 1 n=1 Tax=Episyrphus balteatus TaxID=286459 RepID=UPI002485D420|nr:kelch-like protein 1 [Episyrphus balteatus]
MANQILPQNNTRQIFTDPHHVDQISDNFEKFYEEQKFLDLVLISAIDQVKVKAHRVVLSAASDYFMAMFSSPLKEANAQEIEVQGIDGVTLLSIVEFVYSGNIMLHTETVENILRAADFLQIRELISVCCLFMSEHIDDTNCLGIAIFAEHLSYTELYEKACSFATQNFGEVCQEKEFLELSSEQLIRLISSRDPEDSSVDEETVFFSIADWYDHDKANRERFLFDLLSLIQYQSLTPKFIIENRHSVCALVECYEMILSWIEWHLSPETHDSPNVPTNRIVKKKNILLAIAGGTSTDDLKPQMFRSQLNWWSNLEIPSSPIRKEAFGIIVIDEKMIIVGGKSTMDQSSNTVECLHLGTMEWSELPSMLQPRHCCAVIELNGDMYAIAGYSGPSMIKTVEKYDFATEQWHFVAPLLRALHIAEVAVINGMIYAVDVAGDTMQCYDPSTNEWTFKQFKQEHSKYFGIAAASGYLYAIGGYINGKPTNTCERYNPLDNTWTFVASMEEPRSGAKCVVLKNRIVVCAGRSDDGLSNRVVEYNPRTNEWKSLTPMLSAMDGRAKILSY